jgi:hypothetical protein
VVAVLILLLPLVAPLAAARRTTVLVEGGLGRFRSARAGSRVAADSLIVSAEAITSMGTTAEGAFDALVPGVHAHGAEIVLARAVFGSASTSSAPGSSMRSVATTSARRFGHPSMPAPEPAPPSRPAEPRLEPDAPRGTRD